MVNPNVFIDIHVPSRRTSAPEGPHIDAGLSGYGRPELALALQAMGAEVAFSRGSQAYDFDTGTVHVLHPRIVQSEEGYKVHVSPQNEPIGEVDAIRNTTLVLGHGLPELNHPDLRAVASDRIEAGSLLRAAGSPIEYALWRPGMPIDETFDAIAGDQVAFKPRRGYKGGIHIGTKAAMVQKIADGEISDDLEWCVETGVSRLEPMPVIGEDIDQDAAKIAMDQLGRSVLRSYVFGRDETGVPFTSHVLSRGTPGLKAYPDDFIFIDQTTVPEDILEGSDRVLAVLERRSSVREAHIAIDWGRIAVGAEAQYAPLAVYAHEPRLVTERENVRVAREQAALLAHQLVRIAVDRGAQA